MKFLVLVNFKAVPKASFNFHIIAYLYPHKNEIRQEMGERIGQFYVLSRCSFWVWCPRLLECSQKEAMSCSHRLHCTYIQYQILYFLAFMFNFWFNLITFSILKLTHESLVKNNSQVNKIWCNYIFALNQTRSWPNSLSGSEIIYWCRPFSGVYLVVIIKLISAADCLGSGCAICISVVVLHEL